VGFYADKKRKMPRTHRRERVTARTEYDDWSLIEYYQGGGGPQKMFQLNGRSGGGERVPIGISGGSPNSPETILQKVLVGGRYSQPQGMAVRGCKDGEFE